MQTIRIPKNLLYLSEKLPVANYDNKKNNSGDLPEIRQINQKRKPKNREGLQENLENSSNAGEPQIASIKKKHAREISNHENNIALKNSKDNNEEDAVPIKLVEKREKSPSG
jgi:hypothetical protein